ncbi:phage protein NinX family protein [Pseudomonas sp. NPDC089422]|uniref:phage protein NinX family protein n=1 Tax=Pseudomonas sp. NPDC089422 TaxID=3364466 RepID=UPI0038167572
MTDLIEVKTADLSAEALGWAVGKAEGLDVFLAPPQYGNPWRVFARYQATAIAHAKRYNPWEDWALAGPLVEKHRVWMHVSGTTWSALITAWVNGCDQPAVAICRAIVADKIGDTVQVPKELMQ